ncbi:MAG: hypothetical protein JXA17_03825 [Dehalococcoidales bacterium]|nr:hypothetical protein [Dehalococcoidales bacterium]
MDKNWWKKNYLKMILLVIAVIIAGLIGKFILILKDDPGWAQSYTAVGTLILAFFTMVLALATFGVIWQNHIYKKEERKERLLNEIIEWAIDVSKTINEHMISMDLYNKRDKGLISFICNGIDQLLSRGRYIYLYANIFGGKSEKAINETNENLKACLDLYINYKYQKYNEVFNIYKNIGENTNTIIDEVTNIKIQDLQ